MSEALNKLNDELTIISKKIRQQLLAKAIFEGLAYLLAGLIAFFILDRLGDFPLAFRVIVLISGVLAILYFLKAKYWLIYTSPYSNEEVSLLVEKKFPEFRSRVISTLQFSKNKPGKMVSADLVDGMMKQTFKMVEGCDLSQLVDDGPLKKALKHCSVAILCIICVSLITPQYFGVYFQRFISQVAYPTQTQFVALTLPEYSVAGENTPISISMSGELPVSGYLRVYSSGDKAEYDIMHSEEEGLYKFDVPGQMSDLSLKFKIGDFSSQEYDLPVKKRPAISELNIEVTPPTYTGLSQYLENAGNIQVPAGSSLKFNITSTKELESFEIVSDAADLAQVQGQGRDWSFVLDAEQKMNYSFRMTAKDTLISKGIPDFRLRVKADRAPRVRIIEPSSLRELSPVSKMLLQAEFEDDYQISEVKVLYTVIDSEYDSDLEFEEFKIWKSFEGINQRTFGLKEVWDNRSIAIEAGKNLKIRLEVTDNSPEPQVSFSQDILVPIISREELKRRLADEFINTIEPVEDILLKLNDVNRKIDRLGDK